MTRTTSSTFPKYDTTKRVQEYLQQALPHSVILAAYQTGQREAIVKHVKEHYSANAGDCIGVNVVVRDAIQNIALASQKNVYPGSPRSITYGEIEDSNANTSTLDGARYVLTVKNETNRLYDKGSLVAGTEVVCLRRNESGYYLPCVAFIVEAKSSGRITVDLYADRSERVTVSPKAILWSTPPETCAECGLYFPSHAKRCGSLGS